MTNCRICSVTFKDNPDKIVLCENYKGVVHLGCCSDRCSWDHKPCFHALGVYKKE